MWRADRLKGVHLMEGRGDRVGRVSILWKREGVANNVKFAQSK